MDVRHYEEYKTQLAQGVHVAASAALAQFLASFVASESKAEWVRWYLANERWDQRIRHEIYEQLIFPVLLDGYQRGDLWCLRWLIRTVSNIYTGTQLWEQIDRKTELTLREELVARAPEDARARRELVDCFITMFRHNAHEWPRVILCGMDGASVSQCAQILAAAERALELDVERRHHAFIEEFVAKVRLYQQRLQDTA
jgi:hypothetical protein